MTINFHSVSDSRSLELEMLPHLKNHPRQRQTQPPYHSNTGLFSVLFSVQCCTAHCTALHYAAQCSVRPLNADKLKTTLFLIFLKEELDGEKLATLVVN